MNPLSQIIGGQKLDTQTLPYTGEQYSASDTSNVQAAGANPATQTDLYAKYRDPKTGEVMTPEEYAVYLGGKIPTQNGDANAYAGDALADPNKSSLELTSMATSLNNARNNIAVGETDPYKVANKSGIAYSPEQLKAIQNAYAGVYDPALEDVFTRLREKKADEEKAANASSGGSSKLPTSYQEYLLAGGEEGTELSYMDFMDRNKGASGGYNFTNTQVANGASTAKMLLAEFTELPDDIKNFYINPPMDYDALSGKTYPMTATVEELFKNAAAGDDINEIKDEIFSLPLSPYIQMYFINSLPNVPQKEKESWLQEKINAVKNGFLNF